MVVKRWLEATTEFFLQQLDFSRSNTETQPRYNLAPNIASTGLDCDRCVGSDNMFIFL